MYESVLDVSADDLPAATDRCLASAGAARVAEYEPAGDGRMAVIVQRMVAPAAAGVALTADPINGDRSSCVVTAVRGLGERLVSGEAMGDEWVVRERSRHASPPARARHRSPPGAAGRDRGPAHRERARDAAGHRVGDRRRRHAVDPPGQADDGAAAATCRGTRPRRARTPACSASASGSASRSLRSSSRGC